MAMPASRTVPSSPNPSAQSSPRTRDWANLRTGEPGTAFRGITRGRGGRGGGTRGTTNRGGGHPPSNSGQKGGSLSESTNSAPSMSTKLSSVSRKPPVQPTITVTMNDADQSINGTTERSERSKPGSRKPPQTTTPASPSESRTAPPTPSRSANRRRRSQPGKGAPTAAKPPPVPATAKSQKSRAGSTPASQTILRKDIPPHLAAAHEAEIRHDIDVLVERVRAVAMAENRPTTPGSHIDWAGDDDDSLPDLNDWGITTTHTNLSLDEDKSEGISPILTDTLRPLPEPNSDVHEERDKETYDAQLEQGDDSPTQPPSLPSPMESAGIESEEGLDQCTIAPPAVEEPPSLTHPNGNIPLHPSLPLKPVAAIESLRTRAGSTSKASNLPPKPSMTASEDDPLMCKSEGLAESIHAPPADKSLTLERVPSASSSERGLGASIHAPVSGLPESHSAPSLLTSDSSSAAPRTHSRSQTEGRVENHQSHAAPTSNRHGRSGATSPLGKHVYTHSRNRSTPAGGSRVPQASRPVITGEAISRLARSIGGMAPAPASRTQTIPTTKDSTISS